VVVWDDHIATAVRTALTALDLTWAKAATPAIALLHGRSAARDPLQIAAWRVVIDQLGVIAPGIPVSIPARSHWATTLLPGGNRQDWISIALPPAAERFRSVQIPRVLAEIGDRCLITALSGPVGDSDDRPMLALAAYAHPGQALTARFSREHPGALAELATALRCRFYLCVGAHGGLRVAIATPDLIAADLVWLALRDEAGEVLGPWQDPLVQRATELELGVRIPAELRLLVRTAKSDQLDPAPLCMIERVRLRLGIP
jgi:hypothetical protein